MASSVAQNSRLSYQQRIRAMYRRYCRHKIHLVDDALERHAEHLERYLEKLTSRYGPEPTLLYSFDVYPELLPAVFSPIGRANAYTQVTLSRLLELGSPMPLEEENEMGENDLSSDEGAGYYYSANNKRKLRKKVGKKEVGLGQIDQEVEREALGAKEHRARAKTKNQMRSFFFKLELQFSDGRTQLLQREHEKLLRDAVQKEVLEEANRKAHVKLLQERKDARQRHETEINALVHRESKDRTTLIHQSHEEMRIFRKKVSDGLTLVQKAALVVARAKALQRKTQIDGNAALSDDGIPGRTPNTDDPTSFGLAPDDPVVLLLKHTSMAENASSGKNKKGKDKQQAEVLLLMGSDATPGDASRKRTLYELSHSRRKEKEREENEFSREDCAPIRDFAAEAEQRKAVAADNEKIKMRRLALLNAKQREIITNRMNAKRRARNNERMASQRAAGEVQEMLASTRSDKGIADLRERRQLQKVQRGSSRKRVVKTLEAPPAKERERTTTLLALPPVA